MIKTYEQAIKYLDSFIPQKRLLHTGETGILRTKYLLRLLENPQEEINVIHVAGTSGKGSTAFLISKLLASHGFKVGFQVSPHLVDLRERFQINNQLIHKELLISRLNEIISAVEKVRETQWGKLTFFEVCVSLAFYIFWKENVDYTIMETGLGGLYDGTNVVENPKKLAIITKIGFDHQNILGYTLSAIASQKAGIIKTGNTVISVQQKSSVMRVFYSQCKTVKAKCIVVKKDKNFWGVRVLKRGTRFNYRDEDFVLSNLKLGLIGEHQAENCSLALTALYHLAKRDHFSVNETKIRSTLRSIRFGGRGEIRKTKYRDVIIDGAHNPQKMKAFITSLKTIYPNKQFDFLIAFSRGKDQLTTLRGILHHIIPVANRIILTSFRLEGQGDMLHSSIPYERIIPILKEFRFSNYSIKKTTKEALVQMIKDGRNPFVITGSLYLIGSIYRDFKHAIRQQ
jgi:dihydrofolate synthase/folylpolyglutamate synthase